MGRNRSEGARDSRRYYDWLERAHEDIKAAELLMGDKRTLNAAAFHCQQCIEKALKAYILFKTRSHADGHNLTWLCKQAIKQDRRFLSWIDESAALNRYYIETRYPSDIPFELTKESVGRICSMAHSMYKFILNEMRSANHPASAHLVSAGP